MSRKKREIVVKYYSQVFFKNILLYEGLGDIYE